MWASLPERGLGFISAFVAAFVAQKVERDQFKLKESTLYKQTDTEGAPDLCGTQPSSAIEGDAVFFGAPAHIRQLAFLCPLPEACLVRFLLTACFQGKLC